jgi:hypothetical protein
MSESQQRRIIGTGMRARNRRDRLPKSPLFRKQGVC